MALLISNRSSDDRESLTAGDALSDSATSDGNDSSCSPISSGGGNGQPVTLLPICAHSTLDGKELPRASPSALSAKCLEGRLLFFLGGGEAEENEEDREDGFLRGPISLGTEPWGEDAATSIPEIDEEKRRAGVREAQHSVEPRERHFCSVRLEEDTQNSQKMQLVSSSLTCSGPRQKEHLPCLS